MSAVTAIRPASAGRLAPAAGMSPNGAAPAPSGVASLSTIDRDVKMHARRIAQAAVEVLAGTRPAQQLSRSLDPRSLASLQHRAVLTRAHAMRAGNSNFRHHRNPQVRSVHACAVSETVYEAALVVHEDLRSRAVAMRLELSNGAWNVTALQIG